MYSVLSELETENIYKINGKFEFLLHYPELTGNNYNWWRQNLSPTIQTENVTAIGNEHFVPGYENVSVHYTDNNWGGLALTAGVGKSYINGGINSFNWFYAIGAYGLEQGIPGPNKPYLNIVALYARIKKIGCNSCKIYRNSFLNSYSFLFVFILM